MRTDVGTVGTCRLGGKGLRARGISAVMTTTLHPEALTVLLDAYRTEVISAKFGSKMPDSSPQRALWPAWCQAAFTQYPSMSTSRSSDPSSSPGLPRTGTTAVHRLLSRPIRAIGVTALARRVPASPSRHGKPGRRTRFPTDAGTVRQGACRGSQPALRLTPDEVEECWQLLRQSLRSVSLQKRWRVPSYARWLAGRDWTRSLSAAPLRVCS